MLINSIWAPATQSVEVYPGTVQYPGSKRVKEEKSIGGYRMAATIDEADVCGICLETLPRWGEDFTRFTCCGKGMHKACTEELQASAHRNKCPMCRAPVTTELENHRRALKWAERGKAWAMTIIAQNYGIGRGVQKSHKTARLWYGRAAEQGHAQAQYYLAIMHREGKGGPMSLEQARVWYGRAAEQGDAEAQCNLAIMHYSGEGGPVSMDQARVWCGRAAEQGHAKAQCDLGVMHEKGEGGPVSMEQARVWYGRAAEQGHGQAQHNLGVMLENGQGGPVSMEQARVWYGRAAEQGHAKAQYHLALLHKNCLLYTSPSPRDRTRSRMPSSA